jgi:uncharacterized membrane protein
MLIVEPGVVLADIPENVVEAEIANESLVMRLIGPARVEYAVVSTLPPTGAGQGGVQNATTTVTATGPSTTTNTTTKAQTATVTESIPSAGVGETTTMEAGTSTGRRGGPSKLATITAAVIAAAALTVLLLLVKVYGGKHHSSEAGGSSEGGGGVEPILVTLDPTDILILRKLREAGGSMYQSELQKATGLPKTTVWRHVRKLAQLGYVRVEREGKYNRVILVKYPEEEGASSS